MSDILFVTATDTGVGKTLLTQLLLSHFQRTGVPALAMKPFCSGGREDVNRIQRLQGNVPPRDSVNPFYFAEPLAPLVAARRHRRRVTLQDALRRIRGVKRPGVRLIVEGAGGVLVPLGEGFCVADLIAALKAEAIIVAPNRLGTINHTRLTVEALQARGVRRMRVVLMGRRTDDLSAGSNARVLRELLKPVEVWTIPKLGRQGGRGPELGRIAKTLKKVLARVAGPDNFCARSSERPRKRGWGEATGRRVKKDRQKIVDSRR